MENLQINMFALPNEQDAVNELKLVYKRHDQLLSFRETPLNSSKKVAKFLREIFDEDQLIILESFYAIYLDTACRIVGYQKIGEGGFDAVPVDARIIYTTALLSKASNVILAHNHPSGTLYPSTADIQITNRIRDGLKTLDLQLADHIILTETSYYSFNDEGRF